MESTLPIWRQRQQIRARYPDAILLFRLGDFIEAYEEDADEVAAILGNSVLSRKSGAQTMRVTGFPRSVAEDEFTKLTNAGHKLVYCERLCEMETELQQAVLTL